MRLSVKIGNLGVLLSRLLRCSKVRYGHKSTALKAADSMHKKTGDSYDAYHCAECEAWHIGHARS